MHKTTLSYSTLFLSIVLQVQAAEMDISLSQSHHNDFKYLDSSKIGTPLVHCNISYYEQAWEELIDLLPNNLHTHYPTPSFTDENNSWDEVYQEAETTYKLHLSHPGADATFSNIQKLNKKKSILEKFLSLKTVIDQNKDNLSIKKSPNVSYQQHLNTPIKYSRELIKTFMQQIGNTFNQYNPSAKEYDYYETAYTSIPSQVVVSTASSQSNSSLTQSQHTYIEKFFNECKNTLNIVDHKIKTMNLAVTNILIGNNNPHYPTIWQELKKLSSNVTDDKICTLTEQYNIFIKSKESESSEIDIVECERRFLSDTIAMYPHYTSCNNNKRCNISANLTPEDKLIIIKTIINERTSIINQTPTK